MSNQRLGGIISATYNPLAGSPSTVEYLVVAGGAVAIKVVVAPEVLCPPQDML